MAVALAGLYLAAPRRGQDRLRAASFLAGCGLLVAALVAPLDTLAREYLDVWAHLVQNVVLAEWAPLLLVLGSADACRTTHPPAARARADPPVRDLLWVGTRPALWRAGALRRRASPPTSSLLVLEHATYVATGILFWWCVWQDAPHRHRRRRVPRTSSPRSSSPRRWGSSSPWCRARSTRSMPTQASAWGLTRLGIKRFGRGMTMAAEQSITVFFVVFALWFTRFPGRAGAGRGRGKWRDAGADARRSRSRRRRALTAGISASATGPSGFPLGVAAGEVTPTSAKLWARPAGRPGDARGQLRRTPGHERARSVRTPSAPRRRAISPSSEWSRACGRRRGTAASTREA